MLTRRRSSAEILMWTLTESHLSMEVAHVHVERSRGDGLNSRAVRISCWAGTSLSLGGGTIEGGTA